MVEYMLTIVLVMCTVGVPLCLWSLYRLCICRMTQEELHPNGKWQGNEHKKASSSSDGNDDDDDNSGSSSSDDERSDSSVYTPMSLANNNIDTTTHNNNNNNSTSSDGVSSAEWHEIWELEGGMFGSGRRHSNQGEGSTSIKNHTTTASSVMSADDGEEEEKEESKVKKLIAQIYFGVANATSRLSVGGGGGGRGGGRGAKDGTATDTTNSARQSTKRDFLSNLYRKMGSEQSTARRQSSLSGSDRAIRNNNSNNDRSRSENANTRKKQQLSRHIAAEASLLNRHVNMGSTNNSSPTTNSSVYEDKGYDDSDDSDDSDYSSNSSNGPGTHTVAKEPSSLSAVKGVKAGATHPVHVLRRQDQPQQDQQPPAYLPSSAVPLTGLTNTNTNSQFNNGQRSSRTANSIDNINNNSGDYGKGSHCRKTSKQQQQQRSNRRSATFSTTSPARPSCCSPSLSSSAPIKPSSAILAVPSYLAAKLPREEKAAAAAASHSVTNVDGYYVYASPVRRQLQMERERDTLTAEQRLQEDEQQMFSETPQWHPTPTAVKQKQQQQEQKAAHNNKQHHQQRSPWKQHQIDTFSDDDDDENDEEDENCNSSSGEEDQSSPPSAYTSLHKHTFNAADVYDTSSVFSSPNRPRQNQQQQPTHPHEVYDNNVNVNIMDILLQKQQRSIKERRRNTSSAAGTWTGAFRSSSDSSSNVTNVDTTNRNSKNGNSAMPEMMMVTRLTIDPQLDRFSSSASNNDAKTNSISGGAHSDVASSTVVPSQPQARRAIRRASSEGWRSPRPTAAVSTKQQHTSAAAAAAAAIPVSLASINTSRGNSVTIDAPPPAAAPPAAAAEEEEAEAQTIPVVALTNTRINQSSSCSVGDIAADGTVWIKAHDSSPSSLSSSLPLPSTSNSKCSSNRVVGSASAVADRANTSSSAAVDNDSITTAVFTLTPTKLRLKPVAPPPQK